MNILSLWRKLSPLPGGKWFFSRLIGFYAPYTGTLPFTVLTLEPGLCRVTLPDCRKVRNHLGSIHAVALMNLGEMTTGVGFFASIPPNARFILKHFEIDYLKKARGRLISEARIPILTDTTQRDIVLTSVIRNSDGETVAEAKVTWRVGPK
jgi:acyl-coenzyme A thioesterase PaaI-like protein